ncbi:hypothetical protein ACFX13_037621 [Malus domestica]
MRLPVKSLCRFECVSKSSSNIICCPFFTTLLTRSLLNSANSVVAAEVPQLMLLSESITCGYDHKIMAMQLQLSKPNGEYELRKTKHALLVTKFPNNSLGFVFCNLFLFKREWESGGPFFLLNPLRGEVLKLPISDRNVANYIGEKIIAEWYGVGFDNLTNTAKIVRVFKKGAQIQHTNTMVAEVCALGTSSWREIDSVPPCDLSGNKTSAYGDMHWFVYKDGNGEHDNHIISFDFNKEELFWTPHPNIQFSHHRSLVHLLNLRGCLAVVDLSSDDCIDVWVLKNKRVGAGLQNGCPQVCRRTTSTFNRELWCMEAWHIFQARK